MDLLTETLKMCNSTYHSCHSFHPFTSALPLPSAPPPPQLPYHFSLLGLQLLLLLYVQLTISFLIGRKPTVNFPNQHLRHHLAADYTIIMSRTLKVTANHVIFDRGA